jgi:hypothetical protein
MKLTTVQLLSYFDCTIFVNVQQLLNLYLGTLRRVRVRWVAIVAKSKRLTAKLERWVAKLERWAANLKR